MASVNKVDIIKNAVELAVCERDGVATLYVDRTFDETASLVAPDGGILDYNKDGKVDHKDIKAVLGGK